MFSRNFRYFRTLFLSYMSDFLAGKVNVSRFFFQKTTLTNKIKEKNLKCQSQIRMGEERVGPLRKVHKI